MLKDKKCIIFDLDGTLVDSLWVWQRIDSIYLAKKGIQTDENLQERLNGKSFTEAITHVKESFSLSESIEEITEEWIAIWSDIYKNDVDFKNGALDFLETLHKQKYRLAVGTSNNKTLASSYLKEKKLDHYFEMISTACEAGRGKPHPDVFLQVTETLKVDPKDCFVFEDTLEGVQAGKNAGMTVAAVYDKAHKPFEKDIREQADYYFVDMAEALKLHQQ